jgi:hypothetical protein
MIDLTNFDPIKIGDELAELESEAQDKLAEAKGEFVSRSEKIAAILWDVKQHHPEHLDAICKRAKIGRSRQYELLRIGSGRETAKQSRKKSAKRQTKSRATKKARAAAESATVTDSAPKQPKAKQPKKETGPPLSNGPSAAALAEISFEHCLRGLFQQIEGGLTVEQVIAEVADRARNAQGVEEKLGDLPHQAAVVSAWLARFAAVAAPDGPHGAEAGGQGRETSANDPSHGQ